jgi:ABC-type phosphate transport system substrate-binding protein
MLSNWTRSARRLAPACVVSALAVAGLAAPGAANATRLAHCAGTAINGEGSTLQETAQNTVWAPNFTKATNANPAACPSGPAVTYNTKGKTGSGPGMENWYVLDEFGPAAQGFVGTDNGPTSGINTKIEEQGSGTPAGKEVLTIPTLQAAIAIIVHLPTGCTVESETEPGHTVLRLTLAQKKLEEIYRAKITKWSKLTAGKVNKLVGAGCTTTQKNSEIKRVARTEGSGTTAAFKKSLQLDYGKTTALDASGDWLESAEEPPANTEWPNELGFPVIRGAGSGGVIAEVLAHPGSIGYVNLANARKNASFVAPTGGEGKETFWSEIENKHTVVVAGKTYKIYTDPATNGDVAAKEKSNCEGEEYVTIKPSTGKVEPGKFPPSSTTATWNTVTAELKQTNYPLCAFTYDLALTKAGRFSGHGQTEAELTTTADYLEWILNTAPEGGQPLIEANQDYLSLPTNINPAKNVLKIAQEGATKIQF